MGLRFQSLLRSTLRVWSQYLAICLASIPAAIVAMLLTSKGLTDQAAALVSVPLALILAFAGWRLVVHHTASEPLEDIRNQAASGTQITWPTSPLTATSLVIVVVMTHVSNPKISAARRSRDADTAAGNMHVLTNDSYANSTAG